MRFTVFVLLSDNPLYSVFAGVNLVFFDVLRACYELARVVSAF